MSLEINKQKMKYSLSTGTQPEYKRDEDGNIVYSGYMDSDGEFIYYLDENTGEKIPEYTGNQIEIYSEPVIFYSSISNKLSEATAKEFGIDDSTNYAQLVTDKNAFPLVEGALIWKRSEVGYKDNNKTIIDSTSADYIVKGVADEGLTVDLYLLRKNVKERRVGDGMARKKTISMNCLSQSSIQNAIKQLRAYQDSLTYKCQMVAQKLAEKGVEIARVQIADLDAVFTSELLSSIHSEYEGSTKCGGVWAVVTGSSHAAFVEMGSGIIGKQSPYPGKLPDGVTWNYASGKTIRQLADGRYGWFYPGDDGNWYFTEGMPSRPFMYYTSLQLMKLVEKTVKEVFKNG